MFREILIQALKVLEEAFLERAAKGNRKSMKTKKSQSVFKNLGTVFSEKQKQTKKSFTT